MATTTNFDWETPDDTDLVKDGAAAIRTLGSSIDTSFVDLLGGTTGQVLTKASNTDLDFTFAAPAAGGTNPNLVINGNFAINQRKYVSAANLASGAYGFDRWKSNFTNTTLTFTSAPQGQSLTINNQGGLQQIVERANIPAGDYVLSFSGTATARMYNVGDVEPSYAASPISFTSDGSANVVVEFTASGGTKTLSQVKLEAGTSPTGFVYSGGTIEAELANCQRYYFRFDAPNAFNIFGNGQCITTTEAIVYTRFPVTMRVAPTALEQTGTATNYRAFRSGAQSEDCTAVPSFDQCTVQGALTKFTIAALLVAGNATYGLAGNVSTAFLAWSAEL
jgi:hypothetical protein